MANKNIDNTSPIEKGSRIIIYNVSEEGFFQEVDQDKVLVHVEDWLPVFLFSLGLTAILLGGFFIGGVYPALADKIKEELPKKIYENIPLKPEDLFNPHQEFIQDGNKTFRKLYKSYDFRDKKVIAKTKKVFQKVINKTTGIAKPINIPTVRIIPIPVEIFIPINPDIIFCSPLKYINFNRKMAELSKNVIVFSQHKKDEFAIKQLSKLSLPTMETLLGPSAKMVLNESNSNLLIRGGGAGTAGTLLLLIYIELIFNKITDFTFSQYLYKLAKKYFKNSLWDFKSKKNNSNICDTSLDFKKISSITGENSLNLVTSEIFNNPEILFGFYLLHSLIQLEIIQKNIKTDSNELKLSTNVFHIPKESLVKNSYIYILILVSCLYILEKMRVILISKHIYAFSQKIFSLLHILSTKILDQKVSSTEINNTDLMSEAEENVPFYTVNKEIINITDNNLQIINNNTLEEKIINSKNKQLVISDKKFKQLIPIIQKGKELIKFTPNNFAQSIEKEWLVEIAILLLKL
jgi:hypothetical protein